MHDNGETPVDSNISCSEMNDALIEAVKGECKTNFVHISHNL